MREDVVNSCNIFCQTEMFVHKVCCCFDGDCKYSARCDRRSNCLDGNDEVYCTCALIKCLLLYVYHIIISSRVCYYTL